MKPTKEPTKKEQTTKKPTKEATEELTTKKPTKEATLEPIKEVRTTHHVRTSQYRASMLRQAYVSKYASSRISMWVNLCAEHASWTSHKKVF